MAQFRMTPTLGICLSLDLLILVRLLIDKCGRNYNYRAYVMAP